MDDTISRQAAIDAICNVCSIEGDFHKCDGYPEGSTWCEEITALRAMPSIDAVEVVRCKDCKYASPNGIYGCRLERFSAHDKSERLFAEDYCSLAERREE